MASQHNALIRIVHRLPRFAVVLCAFFLLTASASAGNRPFTVDVMIKAEGLGELMFGPQGEHLLVEKTAAYERSQNFAWARVWSRERATLLNMQGDSGSVDMRTVSLDDEERVWLGSYSPSGAQAAIGWFDGDQARAGVYDFASRKLRKLDYLISINSFCSFDCPYWLSEDTFVHYTLSADEQKKQLSHIAYTDELISRWSRQSWAGDQASVKVYGSGAYQSKAVEEGGTLILVDARTGQTTELDKGLFWEASLSPDRRRLAALREIGNLDSAGSEVKAITGADKILQLVIYDFASGGARRVPCETCNITRGSLRWSPSGSKLFFGARVVRDGKQEHEHYVQDFRRSSLERFAPESVDFKTVEDLQRATFVTPFLWLDDDTPAVRTSSPAATGKQGDVRYRWFALPVGGAPVELTAGLEPVDDRKPLEDYVAVHNGDLFMMADGELWRLSAQGIRKNLTHGIDLALSPWCSVISYRREKGIPPICSGLTDIVVRPIDEAALADGWMTFRMLQDEIPTGDLLFLNVDSGGTMRIEAPASGAELVTASALARAALYRHKGKDGDHLLLASVNGEVQELLHFNRHLSGVVGGTPVMLTRREPGEEEDRIDWLLLPPGHQPGQRHPLLVYFYPDRRYSKKWRSDDLRDVSFRNQHILAAQGYAVLLATMKISTMEERGDPMLEMHQQLIHAAENVVAEGYADPQRWALMGHSYGGYGTSSVITQTNRFKAAIALAGPVNLTSAYAMGLARGKATDVASDLSFGARWSEGGQGRMGVAPWQDPERYVRNSPLFHSGQIETPLLLIHGEDDPVNVGEAEQMFNALHRQGKDVQFLRYWGEGHDLRSPANIRDMWQRIFKWLDENLDIARDADDNVVFDGQRVQSRSAGSEGVIH